MMCFVGDKPMSAWMLGLTLLLCLANPVLAFEREIDQKAVAVLEAMAAHISGIATVEVVSESTADVNLGAGLLAEQAAVAALWIKRPHMLRIALDGDRGLRDMYINDGLLTVYTADRKYYAQASVSKNVDEAVVYAVDELELDFPFFDLIWGNTVEHLLDGMYAVLHLGTTMVRGVECDHVVLRGDEVDGQLFIATGDAPETRKVVFTSKWEGGSPRYIAYLEWNISPRINDSVFEFAPPEGARKIRFINLTEDAE